MKHILSVLTALLLFGATAQAQTAYPDLIVTQTGDTIRCAFRAINETDITYFREDASGNAVKGVAQKSALRYFDKGFYARREATPGTKGYAQDITYYAPKLDLVYKKKPYNVVARIELGVAHRLNKIDDGVPAAWLDLVKKMQTGSSFGLYVGGLIKPFMGVGGRIETYTASQSDAKLKLSDKVSMVAIMANFQLRVPFQPGGYSHFYFDVGPGILIFNENIVYDYQTTNFSAVGTPLRLGAGLHVQVVGPLAVHAGGSLMAGAVTGTVNSKSVNEGISKVGATAGLSFTF